MAVMKSMVVPGRIKVQYWLTLVKKAAPFQLGKYFSLSKKVMNNVLPKVVKESIPTFENSFDNKIRSLRVLYSKGLLSCKSIRLNPSMNTRKSGKKLESLKFTSSVCLPKILPYEKLITLVKSIDVGNVNDFKDLCYTLDADEVVEGSYRELQPFLLQLADMYVCLDKTSPFLCQNFGSELYHLCSSRC